MNSEAVKIVFSEITADNKITAEEEAALYSILEKIHISQTAREGIDSAVSRHKKLTAYYKKIGEEIAASIKKLTR